MLLATAQASEPLIITYDLGGVIAARALNIARLGDQRVEILGICKSACTMYLGASNVCVHPESKLTFHGPSWYGLPMEQPYFNYWSLAIASHYPDTLKDWFMETGRYGSYTIDGAGVIANQWALPC